MRQAVNEGQHERDFGGVRTKFTSQIYASKRRTHTLTHVCCTCIPAIRRYGLTIVGISITAGAFWLLTVGDLWFIAQPAVSKGGHSS